MVNIVAFHVIQIPLLKTSSTFDRHFTQTVSLRGEIISNTKPESQQHRPVASLCTLTKSFPLQWLFLLGKTNQKNPQSTDNTRRWRNPGECWAHLPISDHNRWSLQSADLSEEQWLSFNYLSEFTLPEALTLTYMWHPSEAGTFSSGESPQTLPLEGTSNHRWQQI